MKPESQHWQRHPEPILSAYTSEQAWCKVVLYTPMVIHHDGKYRMWFIGGSGSSRDGALHLGYAESEDGFQWRPHPDNPILREEAVPCGPRVQTPFVMFDPTDELYRMWFICLTKLERSASGGLLEMTQELCYATSADGLNWDLHPEPLYESGRRPCVIREPDGTYHMWMNSRPSRQHPPESLYENVYEFRSDDGIRWARSDGPVIRPSGPLCTCVYPYVIKDDGAYHMWIGGHVTGQGRFEIFSATSEDGTRWETHFDQPSFPATRDCEKFDGRYTSTPCVLKERDRYLLYYSARDCNDEYTDGEGRKLIDRSGVYAHIGVAVWDTTEASL